MSKDTSVNKDMPISSNNSHESKPNPYSEEIGLTREEQIAIAKNNIARAKKAVAEYYRKHPERLKKYQKN